MHCPACAAEVPEDDAFCEACGANLQAPAAPAAGACQCGAGPEEVDPDGFCLRCGRRVRRPASDHIEQLVSAQFAAVSDRGSKHDRNEDRCAVAQAGAGFALVVCDGVSATNKSERASAAVSEAILKSLVAHLQRPIDTPEAAMQHALAAGAATLSNPYQAEPDPPSTTVVAALVLDGVATLGWAGDSRAYWIDATGTHQLTQDHSWLNDAVTSGLLTLEAAEADARAHAITRWFGADNIDALPPEQLRFPIPGPGTLLLCTDGLWNYADTLESFAHIYSEAQEAGPDAITRANHLIQFAIHEGGRDNITVAILELAPAAKAASFRNGRAGLKPCP